MNVAKRQHYVPRFYLAGFIDPAMQGMLWVYEGGKAPRPSRAESCGFENRLYDFVAEGERRSLEVVLKDLDAAAAPVFRAISATHSGTDLEWETVIAFIAFQATRVPSALRKFDAAAQKGADRLELSAGARTNLKEAMASGRHRLETMVEMADEIGKYLRNMNRILMTPDDDRWPFVTCDAPFGVWTADGVAPTLPGMQSSDETDICFPIRRDACVLFSQKTIKVRPNLPAQAIRDTNKILIRSAERFVFASERNPKLQRIVDRMHLKRIGIEDA